MVVSFLILTKELVNVINKSRLRMLALSVSEIGQNVGTPQGFTLQPHVKIVHIDHNFSFDSFDNKALN